MPGFEFGAYLRKKKMGKVKDWKMAMEELAAEAVILDMGEAEAVEYMVNNLEDKYPTMRHQLKIIFKETRKEAEDLGIIR